jgi:hypothetical protein
MKEERKQFFCLKMIRKDSKSFTVYFQAGLTGNTIKSPVQIVYVSGKEMADVYNIQKQNTVETNTQELQQTIIDKLENPLESNVLEFDKTNLLKNLIITDDEGVNTYKFYTTDSVNFFRDLSSMRYCFTD